MEDTLGINSWCLCNNTFSPPRPKAPPGSNRGPRGLAQGPYIAGARNCFKAIKTDVYQPYLLCRPIQIL